LFWLTGTTRIAGHEGRQRVKLNESFGEDQARLAAKRRELDRNGKSIGVQVIARAADVLRALEVEPGGLSLAKIAQSVELPRSTVHRIVTALEAESLVVPASA
jgi:uncharacterized membrane protein